MITAFSHGSTVVRVYVHEADAPSDVYAVMVMSYCPKASLLEVAVPFKTILPSDDEY